MKRRLTYFFLLVLLFTVSLTRAWTPNSDTNIFLPLIQNESSVIPFIGKLPGALPFFDIRESLAVNSQPDAAQTNPLNNFPTAAVTWNERYGVPKLIVNHGGFLTSPSSDAAATIALNFLRDNQVLFGFDQNSLDNLVMQTQYQTAHNGATHIVFTQTDNGRTIFGSHIKLTIDHQGRVAIVGGTYYPTATTSAAPNLSVNAAVETALSFADGQLDAPLQMLNTANTPARETSFANTVAQDVVNPSDITAELVTFPMPTGHEARLAWQVIAEVNEVGWYEVIIDATTGELLFRQNYYASDGPEGTVFTGQHPDASGNTRTLVPFDGASFNDNGWVTDNTTSGNNVNAYQDLNDDDTLGYQPTTLASPDPAYQHFTFPFADLWRTNGDGSIPNASADLDATITQLFYYTNVMHDYLYTLGFDEAAGNFQVDNFGHPGSGGDPVNAEAQDGYNFGCKDEDNNSIRCINNANFGTPMDGSSPRMQMYMWAPTRPYRDGSLDGDVIAHEYGHGVSSRLITGKNLCCGQQTRSLGEGWSDTISMYMWDDSTVGEYVTGNTNRGIRSVNYASSPYVYSDFGWVTDVCEEHCNGEIWATVMFDMQQALINAYGNAAGQALADQLLIDGMKNTVNSPSFLDARDGILTADMLNNGGVNQCLLWNVFANREMGLSASSSADQMTVTPATDGPASCLPTADAGGPYQTDEGVDIALDGTDSDPGSDPYVGTLSYAWDLDDDNQYDDAFTATPTFDMVGQDNVNTIALRVTNEAGWTDEAETTVTVLNIAPTLTLDPTTPVTENTPITVSGQVSDPGWLENLTATIDWGDGSTVENITDVLENVRPNATLTFSINHTYGDNGTFTAEICGLDDDTTTCETINLQVDNTNPTATIDLSGAILVNGIPTILGTAGEPVDFSANSTDPGSDDLTLSWVWNDGSPVEQSTSLVNDPLTDPFPSPSIQPRDITTATSHTFGDACIYEISFWAEDDDGGVSPVDQAYVLIVGTADQARHDGYWQHQYSGNGAIDFDEPTLQCYLEIAGFLSTVFNEERDASTIPNAFDVLFMQGNGGSEQEKFDRRLLTVLLNIADGSMGYQDLFDTENQNNPNVPLADIITAAEAVRLNPVSTSAELQMQTQLLIQLVNQANINN